MSSRADTKKDNDECLAARSQRKARETKAPLPTYAEAQAAAAHGIGRALNTTLKKNPEWAAKAYAFLEAFARENETFISEDVSDLSRKTDFPQPHTDRAWGAIYLRAAKSGLIRQEGVGRSRRRHHSICLKWRSLVYGVPLGAPPAKAKPNRNRKIKAAAKMAPVKTSLTRASRRG